MSTCDASWEFYQTACNLGPGDPATDHTFLNQLSGVFSANVYKIVRETDCEMISKMFNGVRAEKNEKETPIWGVAQFGEMSYPGI